jgi:hypothetical protein
MGIPVMILGESGSGKTASLRNLNPDDCILIQAVKKPLPFKSDFLPWDSQAKTGSIIATDKSAMICRVISGAHNHGKSIIIIDDYQYTMANEFMRRVLDKESGNAAFAKYNEIAKQAWDIAMAAINTPDNVRVYILSHTQTDDSGNTKVKTIGKLLDDKITLEGMFTIVMRSMRLTGEYKFSTQTNGMDTVKTPMDLFSDELIDSDLNYVDQQIQQYYNLGN